ncbi:hypothetical protein [Salinispora mooreana]|uniref:hypothetical protein n=1 Tax=Salinispora mooreana TaxID=999545 RepID=UPI00037DB8B3|nr:hypothetical protein [Salinispora mooreana]
MDVRASDRGLVVAVSPREQGTSAARIGVALSGSAVGLLALRLPTRPDTCGRLRAADDPTPTR